MLPILVEQVAELAAEVSAEAANEAIKAEIQKAAVELAENPGFLERMRESARKTLAGLAFDAEYVSLDDIGIVDSAMEQVEKDEFQWRMERARQKLGISSEAGLEQMEFVSKGDVKETSAFQHLRQFLEQEQQAQKGSRFLSMDEFAARAAKGEL